MTIPCNHTATQAGCYLCELAERDERYWHLWRAGCRFRGLPLTLEQVADLDLDQTKTYSPCGSPRQPLGEVVCHTCSGCGPKCPDYRRTA